MFQRCAVQTVGLEGREPERVWAEGAVGRGVAAEHGGGDVAVLVAQGCAGQVARLHRGGMATEALVHSAQAARHHVLAHAHARIENKAQAEAGAVVADDDLSNLAVTAYVDVFQQDVGRVVVDAPLAGIFLKLKPSEEVFMAVQRVAEVGVERVAPIGLLGRVC